MAQNASQAITGRNSFDDNRYRPSSVDDLTNLPFGINIVVLNKNISVQTGPSTTVTISNGSYLVFCYHADDSDQILCVFILIKLEFTGFRIIKVKQPQKQLV